MTGPVDTSQDEVFDPETWRHQLLLLKSAHCCRQVIYEGKYQFIHGLSLNVTGSAPEMTVYLGGVKDGIDSREIQIKPATQGEKGTEG
jgi:hypothetical protein